MQPSPLLAAVCAKVSRSKVILSKLADIRSSTARKAFVDTGSIFAIAGGAAIGCVANAFKPVGAASPLRVISLVPMEMAT